VTSVANRKRSHEGPFFVSSRGFYLEDSMMNAATFAMDGYDGF
jgi:hypothetical protein